MRLFLACLASLLICTNANATEYDDHRIVQYVSNYDGDTITVNIPGWPSIVGDNISVRILGIDTPEMHDRRANIHTIALQARNLVHDTIVGGHSLELRHVQRDKYFRLLADVYVDGASLAEMLLTRGLARPYDGGTKTPW